MSARMDSSISSSSTHGGAFQVIIHPDATTTAARPSGAFAVVNSKCLLCLVSITPSTSPSNIAQHYNNAFEKLCTVLKVNLSPFSWNFLLEPFPFCPKCATTVFSLYDFYEKVKEIEKLIDNTISQIKCNIKSSETTKTTMPSDVRAVIFRGQVLKDLGINEPGVPRDSDQSNNVSKGNPAKNINNSMTSTRKYSLGLVYNPPETSTAIHSSQAYPSESVSETRVTPATTVPALVAVSSLDATNVQKPVQNQSFSSLVSESMNVIAGNSQEGPDVDLKQILRAVEVYPTTTTTSGCSPTKSANEIMNLNYVAANETIITGRSASAPRNPDTISVEVTPDQVQVDNDFEPYHDDSHDDPDYNESEDNEEDEEIKKAVSIIEHDVNSSACIAKSSRAQKRGGSTVSNEYKRKKLSFNENKQFLKTEPMDSNSEVPTARKKTKSKGQKTAKPKSEHKQYVSLIQTDSCGNMFYEGIPINTCYQNPKAVSCGECGKIFENHEALYRNKRSAISHIRTYHLDEWHDGEKLVKRKRAPPVSYVSMLETDDQGRVFFKGHEIIGGKETPGFSCGTCGKSYTGQAPACEKRVLIIRHIQAEHLGGSFDCDQCNASYKSKGSLYDHKLKKHVHGEMECDICGKKMFRKYLENHRFTHLNQEEREAAFASGTAPALAVRKLSSYICNVCGIVLKGPDGLRRHEKTHTSEMIECKLCGKLIKSSSMATHIRHVHKKRNRGSRCPKCYKTVKNMEAHMAAHLALPSETEKLSFECSICGMKSSSEEKNRIHETTKHLHGATRFKENYTFACDFCSKRHLSRKSWCDHRRRVHGAEAAAARELMLSSSCADPSRRHLVDYSKMGRHLDLDISEGATAEIETSETGELSFLTVRITKVSNGYECGMCHAVVTGNCVGYETRFIKDHIRAYHLGEFQCDECGKFWSRQSKLNKHKKDAHFVVPCPVCQRPTGQKNLKLHLWSHKSQEEKQAVIDAGDFNAIPSAVKKELGISISRYEVDCNVCGVTIPSRRLLKEHQQAEHPEMKKFWNMNKRKRGNFTDKDGEEDEFSSFSETDTSDIEQSSEPENNMPQHNNEGISSRRNSRTHRSNEHKQPVIDSGGLRVKKELGVSTSRFEVNCNVCGITTPNKRLLEKHQRAEHPETKNFWNKTKRKGGSKVNRKRDQSDEDEEEEEDEFSSLSKPGPSDVDPVSNRVKTKPQHIKEGISSRRSSRSSRPTNDQTSSSSRTRTTSNLKPYVSVSRLPAAISNAMKLTVINDHCLRCTFSDGETQEVAISDNSQMLPTYYEIEGTFIDESCSDSDVDFVVIPDGYSDCESV